MGDLRLCEGEIAAPGQVGRDSGVIRKTHPMDYDKGVDVILRSDDLEYASFLQRVGAHLVDWLILTVILVPLKIAMGMLLTGRHITAQEAYRIGLVNEVTPLENLMSRAESWAEEIKECAPLQIRAIKQTATLGLTAPLEVALKTKFSLLREAQKSEDWMEGPRAFNEKRKPNWQGR